MNSAKMLAVAAFFVFPLSTAIAQTTAPTLSGDQVVERVSPSLCPFLSAKVTANLQAWPPA